MYDYCKSPEFHETVPNESTFEITGDNTCTFENINVWIRVTNQIDMVVVLKVSTTMWYSDAA